MMRVHSSSPFLQINRGYCLSSLSFLNVPNNKIVQSHFQNTKPYDALLVNNPGVCGYCPCPKAHQHVHLRLLHHSSIEGEQCNEPVDFAHSRCQYCRHRELYSAKRRNCRARHTGQGKVQRCRCQSTPILQWGSVVHKRRREGSFTKLP